LRKERSGIREKTDLNGHELLHPRQALEGDLRNDGEGVGRALGDERSDGLVGRSSGIGLVGVSA
jgi:hypothetical protein